MAALVPGRIGGKEAHKVLRRRREDSHGLVREETERAMAAPAAR